MAPNAQVTVLLEGSALIRDKVLAAAREAAGRGVGAFLLDGHMVDAPVIAHAQAIVDLAARINRGVSQNA